MPPKEIIYASWLCLLGLPQVGLLLMDETTVGAISLMLAYLFIALWCTYQFSQSRQRARYVWLGAWLVFVPAGVHEILFDPGWIGTFAMTYMMCNMAGLILTATPDSRWWFSS